jgi:hypothetical protein
VYIREAHAIDSDAPAGAGPLVEDRGPRIEDPTTDEERRSVATACVEELSWDPIPAVIDRVDDAVSIAYSAWPDRLYLVGRDGNLAYTGARGPFGFKPEELGEAIEKELARNTAG